MEQIYATTKFAIEFAFFGFCVLALANWAAEVFGDKLNKLDKKRRNKKTVEAYRRLQAKKGSN